jgi:phosphatidate cytidylyltransferase
MPQLGWAHVFAICIPGAILGQAGDFCESLLKRSFGIKDSGQILPGHGGIMDRVDALVFTAPYMYFYATYVFFA